MTASARPIALLTLLAALLLSAAAPPRAAAHGRFFVGIGPVYPYPYYYYYPPVYLPSAPPWTVAPDLPPPGWVPGQWERHYDRAGRPYDVWVPSHLR
jgi:hypothetical protein